MRIASFVGQKGGVGKSTLARVLAVAAARQEYKVLIGDFDLEQLSCVEWSASRLRNNIEPEIEARAFKSLKKLLKTVVDYDLIVVDTRGLADELTQDISQESDVVFLPTSTSMDDLRPTLALARRLAKTKTVSNKIVIVLSKTGRSDRLLEQAEATIAEAGFDMLNAVWPERDGFQADLDVGKAGSEATNPYLKQAAVEVESAMLTLALGRKG
ncbi:ParA family protein [Limnohabitans sp. 2KL-1]|uniref:ParA family protein n=1 Tax=Limnohabitans sp. 2KL-1 TaxID=1100699 RepID=UPI0013048BC9|nr:ParA family protein [Limnohabitans sp. 2KL-1]